MSPDNFNQQQTEFLAFLKLLDDNNLLDTVIVAGSWCEYVYAQSGLLQGFDVSLRTIDLDFLIKNLRLPKTPTNLTALAANAGYDVETDILYETTKIHTKNGLEIEFLINQMGRGDQNVLKTNLGVTAQALRHMNITLQNTVTVNLFGMNVTIPKPEAYVIHKMVINKSRKPLKQEKDRKSICRLMPFLDKEVYQDIYDGLFKKEQRAVDDFVKENSLEIKIDEQVSSVDDLISDSSKRAEEAYREFQANPKTYSLDEVKENLDLE